MACSSSGLATWMVKLCVVSCGLNWPCSGSTSSGTGRQLKGRLLKLISVPPVAGVPVKARGVPPITRSLVPGRGGLAWLSGADAALPDKLVPNGEQGVQLLLADGRGPRTREPGLTPDLL